MEAVPAKAEAKEETDDVEMEDAEVKGEAASSSDNRQPVMAIVPWSSGGGGGLRIPSKPTFGTPAKQHQASQQR